MIVSLSYELQAIVLLLDLIMLNTKGITGTNVFIQKHFAWVNLTIKPTKQSLNLADMSSVTVSISVDIFWC